MEIDLKRIEADLKDAAGETHYRVHKGKGMRLSIRESDQRVDIYINPKKIRTQNQLDQVISDCNQELTWGQ